MQHRLGKRVTALESRYAPQVEDMETFLARHAAMFKDGRLIDDGVTIRATDATDTEAQVAAELNNEARVRARAYEAEALRGYDPTQAPDSTD